MIEFTNWYVLVQASLLSVSTTTGLKLHKQEIPQLNFSGKFLNYCTKTHKIHAVQITTSVDISPIAKAHVI